MNEFKLDLFVLNSERNLNQPFIWEDFSKHHILGDVYLVNNNLQINSTKKYSPYFFLIYDDEMIEEQATVALRSFADAEYDVVKLYKKEKDDKISIQPRFFKSSIVLPEFGLLPNNWKELNMETCLNGFLFTV